MPRRSKYSPNEESKDHNQIKTIKTLVTYLWPPGRLDLKVRVVLALSSLALAKLINVYVPFLYKSAVDSLSPSTGIIILPLGVIIAYGVARVLHQAFGELRDLIFIKVGQNAQRSIALSTFKHLHELSLRFHLDRQTGGLSRVVERGTSGVQFVLNFVLFNILPTFIEILMVTVILYYNFDIIFATVTFITIFSYIFFTLFVTEWRLKFRQRMNKKDSEANTKSIDSLINYETVKYFNNESHEYKRYDSALAGYEKAAIKSQNSLALLNVGQGIIVGSGLIIVMIMAGQGVADGILTIGDFVMVNTFLIQLYLPLNFLGFVYREIKRSLIDMEKMFEFLEESSEINDLPDAKKLICNGGEVEFRNVDFSYNKDRKILKNVSFKVPSGKKIALVGPSGSGKSTLSRLLFRFYDCDQGEILIAGQDIKEVTQQSLRSSIGIVPQDTVLFNESIGYNIHYGNPDVSFEEVKRVTKLASIDGFVAKLPAGYDTMVGERGLKLSGGEKQRVAIARTILKDPAILLFDEATSALDSQTEKEIQLSLEKVSQNRTTLVIAHRLSTIIDADEILVLKDGEIVETGQHQQLIELDGEYAAMWARQQEATEYRKKLENISGSPVYAN
ncbi:MAG: ABC transporter ATP-binding protein/permease [Proteobacteria bacterium]|nr:ABC transporter ATP-binding protein/permease [Pseudomonadota bacterium]